MGIAPGGRPAAACEISTEGVVAASIAAGQLPVYAAESLPPLSVEPSLNEGNIARADAVTATVRSALNRVQPKTKAVTVVVPDAAVRVFILDFDTFPARAEEALAVLKIRLRKSVHFDVETAGISYQVLSTGSENLWTQWRVLTAVMPGPVLTEYESMIRAAGYEPGAVLPSTLAVLGAVDSQEALMAAHLSTKVLTTSIVSGDDILLYRMLELPEDAEARKAEVQRAVAVASAFYEDKLQARPHRLFHSGILSAEEFAELIDDPALSVAETVVKTGLGLSAAIGRHSIAGVTGALAGTAA
jgi:type IV pilus assembly protein PilM